MTNVDVKLKPCAHCGNPNPPLKHGSEFGWDEDGDYWTVDCPCGITTHIWSLTKVLETWNTRSDHEISK